MTDEQIGQLWQKIYSWHVSPGGGDLAYIGEDDRVKLIRKLVEEREERKLMACPHGGLSIAVCKHPEGFHRNEALRDFSIDPVTWPEST